MLDKATVAVVAQAMDLAGAKKTLKKLRRKQRRRLEQWLFIVKLQRDARGSANDPDRLIKRIKEVFAKPLVIPKKKVKAVIKAALAVRKKYPPPPSDGSKRSYYYWDKVSAMLKPILSLLPSGDLAWKKIQAAPASATCGLLVRDFLVGDQYHEYRMKNRIVKALTHKRYGGRPLFLVRHWLKKYNPGKRGSNTYMALRFSMAVKAAKLILGTGFNAWYFNVRGLGYDDDKAKHGN